MRLIGYILGACILFAIIRAVVFAVLLLIALMLVIGTIYKPRETIGLLGFLLIANLLAMYPLGCLIVGSACVGIALLRPRE